MSEEQIRQNELEALKVLLAHWIKHNQAHAEGFQEWIEKCEQYNLPEVAQEIEKAVELLKKAGECLGQAQKNYAKANIDV